MDRTRSLATVVGGVRTGVGAVLLLAPGRAARAWTGSTRPDPTAQLLTRALGARDVVLGLGTIDARGSRAAAVRMVQLCAVSDLGDALASVLSRSGLDRRRRVAAPAIAAASGITQLVAAHLSRPGREAMTISRDLPEEVSARAAPEVDLRAVDRSRI